MKKQNALITQESTEVVLRKATNIINRTNKILKNSKRELVANPDVMMINGLMWQKETIEEEMDWDVAMEYAKNLRLGGYDDWRLPTKEEFEKIIYSCGGIVLPENCYKDMEKNFTKIHKNEDNEAYQSCYQKNGFLSSSYISFDRDDKANIYFVNFSKGTGGFLDDIVVYVRCVRG